MFKLYICPKKSSNAIDANGDTWVRLASWMISESAFLVKDEILVGGWTNNDDYKAADHAMEAIKAMMPEIEIVAKEADREDALRWWNSIGIIRCPMNESLLTKLR